MGKKVYTGFLDFFLAIISVEDFGGLSIDSLQLAIGVIYYDGGKRLELINEGIVGLVRKVCHVVRKVCHDFIVFEYCFWPNVRLLTMNLSLERRCTFKYYSTPYKKFQCQKYC